MYSRYEQTLPFLTKTFTASTKNIQMKESTSRVCRYCSSFYTVVILDTGTGILLPHRLAGVVASSIPNKNLSRITSLYSFSMPTYICPSIKLATPSLRFSIFELYVYSLAFALDIKSLELHIVCYSAALISIFIYA